MSWMAAGWVKHCRLGSANRKSVMLVIADYATENGDAVGVEVPEGSAVCWAGISEIAASAEVGESTVRRILTDLEAAGVIRRAKRGRRWGIGGRTTDLIYIEYARPFMTLEPLRSQRAVTPVDEAVEDEHGTADDDGVTAHLEGGYRSSGGGVSARLVSAQNLQKNLQVTDKNLPDPNASTDRATQDGETRSLKLVAAPPAHARPPPATDRHHRPPPTRQGGSG